MLWTYWDFAKHEEHAVLRSMSHEVLQLKQTPSQPISPAHDDALNLLAGD